jgi:peptidoglycan hydrolase CwlO-like protein
MAKQLEARVAELEKLVASLKTSDDKVDGSKTKEKLNTNKDGTPRKPKAKTGYLVFSSEKREEVKGLLETEHGVAPKPKDVISRLGAVWKALSDDEKQVYNEKAKKMADEANDD